MRRREWRKWAFVSLLMSGWICCVSGREINQAPEIEVWNEDFDTVIDQAEAGDPYYEAVVASWYRLGVGGFPVDLRQAGTWADRSALQGHALGIYEQAAARATRERQWAGVSREQEARIQALYVEALPGLRDLAARGCPRAHWALGHLHGWPNSPFPDRAKGLEHMRAAAAARFPLGVGQLADFLSTDASSDEAEITRLYGEAARLGRLRSAYLYAWRLRRGQGTAPDPDGAFHWMKVAADGNYHAAPIGMAHCYQWGIGCEPSREEAQRWLGQVQAPSGRMAHDRDEAQWELDLFGATREDRDAIVRRWNQAASSGDADARVRLGRLRLGVYNQNWEAAMPYFLPAAEQGHAEAMRWVGMRYIPRRNSYGRVDPVTNYETAIAWLDRAVAAGDDEAANLLDDVREHAKQASQAPQPPAQ